MNLLDIFATVGLGFYAFFGAYSLWMLIFDRGARQRRTTTVLAIVIATVVALIAMAVYISILLEEKANGLPSPKAALIKNQAAFSWNAIL